MAGAVSDVNTALPPGELGCPSQELLLRCLPAAPSVALASPTS